MRSVGNLKTIRTIEFERRKLIRSIHANVMLVSIRSIMFSCIVYKKQNSNTTK